MTEHCGIGAWAQNSRIIHATAHHPIAASKHESSFTRQSVTWEVFSHEPEVVKAPNGAYVMYFTAQLRSEHGDCQCCEAGPRGICDGSTGSGDCGHDLSAEDPGQLGDSDPTYMSFTMNPYGNWSSPQKIFADYHGADTNFAPLILPNGSLVAMWRTWGGGNGGSRQFLATATDWKDSSSYVQHHEELFPDLGAAGTEDQFLYLDTNGNFHAIFHHMYGTGTEMQWWLDACGGHAFSHDGIHWTYTGVAWGNATALYNTPAGQGNVVEFEDNTTFRFTRRERPHLIIRDKDSVLQYLVTSAQYGNGVSVI
jgi:hypothetical protein